MNSSLLTYCFNTTDIWHQDVENMKLSNRVHDVLANRTNQVDEIPQPDKNTICQKQYNHKYLYPTETYTHQRLCSSMPSLPKSDLSNLSNVVTESVLLFPIDKPPIQQGHNRVDNHRDCISKPMLATLNNYQQSSNRQLFQNYNRPEINASTYPNCDSFMFDNSTKEILKTPDIRNRQILLTEVVQGCHRQC